jgi:hypothetical protein
MTEQGFLHRRGHAIGDDGQLSHIKISNRFGSKILTLDRWIELFGPMARTI